MIAFDLRVTARRKVVYVVSGVLLLLGLVMFFARGFNLGVDFESGLSETVGIDAPGVRIEDVRSALSGTEARVQRAGGSDGVATFIIRTHAASEEERASKEAEVSAALSERFGSGSVTVSSSSFIGAKFSSSLITTSLFAIVVALVCILVYIWFRFRLSFSLASVLTLIHDVLLLLSFIVVTGVEISSITIAAILTIIGYSLNNTIVIFDRVKENIRIGLMPDLDAILDKSVMQSMTRTIFSSLTTLAVVMPMGIMVFNGDIRMFSLVLSVGIAIGIYSSTFVAVNVLRLISSSGKRMLDPMTIREA